MGKSKKKNIRHVCGISGGKDSAALAIYLKEHRDIPEMEYFFSDTGCELPETYDFIDRLQAFLGKKITLIGSERPFAHYFKMMVKTVEDHFEDLKKAKKTGATIPDLSILPSPQSRWCTVKLKLEPFEKFVGDDEVYSYIAIRGDEHRDGYLPSKPNIHPIFPFVQDEITRADVFRILEETDNVGVPEYYKWRSRSGCYFCFFQRQEEWLGLHDHHPNLFKKAMKFEKFDPDTGTGYTWIQGMSLSQLLDRRDEIITLAEKRRSSEDTRSWQEKMLDEGDSVDQGCLICSL